MLSKNKDNTFIAKVWPNVKWVLPLYGETAEDAVGADTADTIEDLIVKMKTKIKDSNIAQSAYKSPTGLEGIAPQDAYEEAANKLSETIKPEYIIKLPNINNGITISKDFELPSPYYANNSVNRKSENDNHNDDYIILDTNIKIEGTTIEEQEESLGYKPDDLKNPKVSEKAKKLLDALKDLSTGKDFRKTEYITKMLNIYADNIYVPYKNVLFETINNNVNVNLTNNSSHPSWTFEALDNTYSEHPISIYKIEDKYGEEEYFKNIKEAILTLKNNENYMLRSQILTHEAKLYKFDNKIFHSINEIYNYIIKNQKGGL